MTCYLDCHVVPRELSSDKLHGIFVSLDNNINGKTKIGQFWIFENQNKFFLKIKN